MFDLAVSLQYKTNQCANIVADPVIFVTGLTLARLHS